MLEPNLGHLFQRPFLPSRAYSATVIDAQLPSAAKSSDLMASGRYPVPLVWNRFVCIQTMADRQPKILLRESASSSSNDYFRFMRCVIYRHRREAPL